MCIQLKVKIRHGIQKTASLIKWLSLCLDTIHAFCFYSAGWIQELNLRKVSRRISIKCQLIQPDWKELKNASYKPDTRLLALWNIIFSLAYSSSPLQLQQKRIIKEKVIKSPYEFLMRSDMKERAIECVINRNSKTALEIDRWCMQCCCVTEGQLVCAPFGVSYSSHLSGRFLPVIPFA